MESRRRFACIGCRLIEPEPGIWHNRLCPRCTPSAVQFTDNPRAIDLTGEIFDRLTVLSYAGQHGKRCAWNCRCECGALTVRTTDTLRSGMHHSCGCLKREHLKEAHARKRKDLTGQVFGHLTVLGYAGSGREAKRSYWNCRCECGSELAVDAEHLKGGQQSCGCLKGQLSSLAHDRRRKDLTDETRARHGNRPCQDDRT